MAILLAVYCAILLGIAIASLKYNDSLDSFLVTNRNQPKILIVASMLASTIGGGITIGTVQKAFAMGFPAFWFVASGAVAHYLQGAFLSARVRETEAVTLPDLAGKLAGAGVRKLVALIILFTWTGIAAGQFLATSKIVGTMTGLGSAYSLILPAVFLVIYTLIGGQKSVLRTDFLQFGILALSIIVVVAWLYIGTPTPLASLDIHLFSAGFKPFDLAYYLVVVAGSYFICPMMFGRILSSKDPGSARTSSFISGTGMLVFAFAITAIGLWAKANAFDPGKLDPLNALVKTVLPGWLGALMMFGILAAIFSTADTVLLTAAGVLEKDIIGGDSIQRTRLWVLAVALVATLVALFETDIVTLLLKTYQGYTSGLVPALFVVIMSWKTRQVKSAYIFTAILAGYILGFSGNFLPTPDGQKAMAFAGLAVSLFVSLLGVRTKKLGTA